IVSGIEVSEFETGPLVQAWPLGSITGRQAPPSALGKVLRDFGGGATDKVLPAPGPEHVIGSNAQDIPFARFAQHDLYIASAVHGVRRRKGKWHLRGKRSRNHSACHLWLSCERHIVRHVRRLQAVGIVRPLPGQIKLTVNKAMAVARHVTSE